MRKRVAILILIALLLVSCSGEKAWMGDDLTHNERLILVLDGIHSRLGLIQIALWAIAAIEFLRE